MSYQTLLDNNIIVKGNFTLKSGKKSDYYVDIKKTISIPVLFNQIINQLCNEIKLIPLANNPICCNLSFFPIYILVF